MADAPLTKITLTPAASKWFKEEMHLKPGNGVKFFGKVYGETNAHNGFSQAMSRWDNPVDPVVDEVVDGIHYYIEDNDYWFFNGLDVLVDYDDGYDGPKMTFTPNDGTKLDSTASASQKDDHHDCQF